MRCEKEAVLDITAHSSSIRYARDCTIMVALDRVETSDLGLEDPSPDNLVSG